MIQPATNLRVISNLALIENALNEGRVDMAFQPIVRANHPHGVVMYEALFRLRDQEGNYVPAAYFMPLVTEHRLESRIDEFAVRTVLMALSSGLFQRLSVNLSATGFQQGTWLSWLSQCALTHPSLVERLTIEITETTALSDPEKVCALMHEGRKLGVMFAVDDFGTGNTSLQYFRLFKFDTLKIDGSFIQHIDQSSDKQAIIQAIVDITKHFGMRTVAEYVETQEEADTLREIGIDYFQGYLYGQAEVQKIPAQSDLKIWCDA